MQHRIYIHLLPHISDDSIFIEYQRNDSIAVSRCFRPFFTTDISPSYVLFFLCRSLFNGLKIQRCYSWIELNFKFIKLRILHSPKRKGDGDRRDVEHFMTGTIKLGAHVDGWQSTKTTTKKNKLGTNKMNLLASTRIIFPHRYQHLDTCVS